MAEDYVKKLQDAEARRGYGPQKADYSAAQDAGFAGGDYNARNTGGRQQSQSWGSGSVNDEAYINQLFDANQAKNEAALKSNYDQNLSDLDAEKVSNQQRTDADLNRTWVESQKGSLGWDELQNAYGLSSGAMAQARLARGTQLEDDLTTIRAVKQSVDADVERRRSLLAQKYTSAIQQAAAENDIEKIKALYQAAKEEEEILRANKEAAGQLMASIGDYSIFGSLYGLSRSQIAALEAAFAGEDGGGGGGGGSYSGGGGGGSPSNADERYRVLMATGTGAQGAAAQMVREGYTNNQILNSNSSYNASTASLATPKVDRKNTGGLIM